ncbi:MAG: hypothetical protein KAH54_02355 [Candidatus Sabulitectum sp.]|nr:hypothetical protein [Candidatus Sabulitectum sp.]
MSGLIRFVLSVFLLSSLSFADILYNNLMSGCAGEVVSTDSRSITVAFTLQSLHDENSGFSSVLRIPEEGLAAIPGLPDMPVIRRMVQVPDRGKIEYEIIESESIVIHLTGEVPPFQPLPVRGEGRPEFVIDSDFYDGSHGWPQSPVILESVEVLRDIRIARAGFYPASWNPSTGDLELTTSLTVRFFATDESGDNELIRTSSDLTRSYLHFYDEVLGFDDSGKVVDGCYLVISTSDGIDTVSELINWKNRKGFEVVTGIIPEIGTTSAEIDAYIENAFSSWPNPPEYILLVGDADMVPSPEYNGHSADNIYGVIGSGCVPSIHVGRLSGESSSDLQYEAWKIVQHEMDPYETGESWFQKGVSVGHTEFVENSLDYMEYMMAAGMDPIWFCESGGITPTVSALSDTINSGISIFGLCGHGSITSISPSGFNIGDIAALQNGRKLPWFALVACQVGWFDGNYCFCEALMAEGSIGDARGGIGAMGPTTNSPYGAADSLVKWIFKGYFQEEVHHMGAVTDWSKNEVYSYFGTSAVDNNHMHMLFGCPEMDIYYDTAPLAVIACTHPDPIQPGTFTFSVNADGTPLEGALVAVKIYDSSTGPWMESDYSDASGNVSFSIPGFGAVSDVYVTATGFNMSPYLYQAVTSVEEAEYISLNFTTGLRLGSSPCSGALNIFYTVHPGADASVEFFDLSGRIVRLLPLDTESGGEMQVVWDGRGSDGNPVSSGVYYCRLRSGTESCVESVLMLN